MLAKRTRDSLHSESEYNDDDTDNRYLPPVGKQRKIINKLKILDEIDEEVFSEHVLKYLDNLEVIGFSLLSTRCREIFRNYQARTREFLFVMENFTEDQCRVIFRECKTIICINCKFKLSNMLNYESNAVNMSIYGERHGVNEELIRFLTLCKFNNLQTLILQGLGLAYDDIAHILTTDYIELLKKNLRMVDLTNNRLGHRNVHNLFKSFPDKLKISFESTGRDLKNKYYDCYASISFSTEYGIARFFYSNEDFKDYKKAFKFFQIASKTNKKAFEFIGYMYDKGRYVKQDYKAAFENYLKGSEEVSNCALNVAMAYENGHGVERNLVQAYKYYEKAAKLQNVKAIKKMARGYQEGVPQVLPQDLNLALCYYSDLGLYEVEEADFQIGHLYEVRLDFKKAASYFGKHLSNLNFLYRYTRVKKLDKDHNGFQKGLEIFRKEFENLKEVANNTEQEIKKEDSEQKSINFTDSMLDILYYIGILDTSNELLQLLFDNISEKTTDIIVKLGDFYRTDQHFADGECAKRFYDIGLSRGDNNAIYGLTLMYISGVRGQLIDLEAATKFSSLLIQTNELSCIFGLGVEFFYEKHYTQAMECFTKTREAYPDAQYYISYIEGYYFEKGKGGYKQNVYRAIDHYKAACNGIFLIPFAFYKCGKLAWKQKYDDLALTVLKPLVAQCQANPRSAIYVYIMGCLYQGGYYLDENQMEAIKLFEISEKMGYQRAAKTYKRVLENLNNSVSSNYF